MVYTVENSQQLALEGSAADMRAVLALIAKFVSPPGEPSMWTRMPF